MKTGISASGQFIEFPMSTERADEKVRVTLVNVPRWHATPTIRIQKRDAKGYLYKGPEFPLADALPLMGAIATLVAAKKP
jgi:hypothetical protein